MNRRDFLLLRRQGRAEVLEISCERLYMLYADASSQAAETGTGDGDAEASEWWGVEPRPVMPKASVDELFQGLERKFSDVHILRVRGKSWTSDPEFGRRLEALLQAFRDGGGRVEFADE